MAEYEENVSISKIILFNQYSTNNIPPIRHLQDKGADDQMPPLVKREKGLIQKFKHEQVSQSGALLQE